MFGWIDHASIPKFCMAGHGATLVFVGEFVDKGKGKSFAYYRCRVWDYPDVPCLSGIRIYCSGTSTHTKDSFAGWRHDWSLDDDSFEAATRPQMLSMT